MKTSTLTSIIGIAAIAGSITGAVLLSGPAETTVTVTKRGDGGVVLTDLKPGDAAYFPLSGSPYSWVYLSLQGTPAAPIKIIAEKGVIFRAGFDIENAQYVKFADLHINQGRVQDNNGVAISIKGKSKNLEFSNIRIDSSGYGTWLKNEHFCDSSLSSWVLDSISFHDYTITDINQHGFYWGPTEAENKTRPINCDGVDRFYNPSKLGNISIYNGTIRNMGKNGIMLSVASVGQSRIYNNQIDNTGLQLVPEQNQGTGIAVGALSNVYVENNTVDSTWLWGIAAFEPKSIGVNNNRVSNWGVNAKGKLEWATSVFLRNPGTFTMGCNTDAAGKLLAVEGNTACTTQPEPPPPTPTKIFLRKGYWIVDGKRLYWKAFRDPSSQSGYTLETGNYTWYKTLP